MIRNRGAQPKRTPPDLTELVDELFEELWSGQETLEEGSLAELAPVKPQPSPLGLVFYAVGGDLQPEAPGEIDGGLTMACASFS